MTKEEYSQFTLLKTILNDSLLTPVFQPIVSNKDNNIYAYEGLIRGPSDSPLHSPFNLFGAAAKHNLLAELDLLCRKVIINKFGRMNLNAKLFVNTIPSLLLQKDYKHGLTLGYIKQANMTPNQVVIELTEQYPIEDYELMSDATKHYKDMGLSIAIDDLGAGYSGLRTWSEINPDYVKIDRHFLNNIHCDINKQHFVQSIIDIADKLQCKIIGEGIEVREEYIYTSSTSIELLQGYYFARPDSQPPKELNSSLFVQRDQYQKTWLNRERKKNTVRSLLLNVDPLHIDASFDDIGMRFQNDKTLLSIPIIHNNGSIAGIIKRLDFFVIYASQYGKELSRKKTAKNFLVDEPITADINLPLSKLSQQITGLENKSLQDDFIIISADRYAGMGRFIDLLKEITDMQITFAKHMNPLSNLPGNVPIQKTIQDAIREKKPSVICYIDIDHFKPYNDFYGFGKGDKVLLKTSNLLTQHTDDGLDFVGHIGGDDFIIIFSSHDWKERCAAIFADFTRLYPELYLQEHIDANGIHALDRQSRTTFHPLLSISIGAIVLDDFSQIQSEDDITDRVSLAKSKAKKTPGNSLYIDVVSSKLAEITA